MLMFSKRLRNTLLLSRCFSSHGSVHSLHKETLKNDTAFVQPTVEELKEQLPTKIMFHERLIHWVNKWLPTIDISFFVRNDRESKLALYYWLGKFELYHSFLFVDFISLGL